MTTPLFAPALAFVDLETTGTAAQHDAITEVGVVRVDAAPDGIGPPTVTEWSSLVDPGVPIPPAIQALTGITDAMVRGAPRFGELAATIATYLDGATFVAHNARFDYGFLKHAFARERLPFSARVLCTVRLSRRLYPDADRHSLDRVVERHGLRAADRHRALGDARVLWEFVQALYRELPADEVAAAVKRVMKTPSLPPQLAPDALDAIPETPGVYRFYGLNALPLYIGKAKNLRERIGAHFSSDYRSATDQRLSVELTRIEFDQTAGELGALIREAALVKALLPAHNHALRRKAESGVLELGDEPGPPRFIVAAAVDPRELPGRYGPFGGKRQAREALRALAGEHALCWKALGLEQRQGPCFARQVRKCAGACVGEESAAAHHGRLRAALASHAIPVWPHAGPVAIRESDPLTGRVDVHVARDWCWLGTARDDGELQALVEAPPQARFDADIARLLMRTFARGRHEVRPLPVAAAHGAVDADSGH
jgi:DNA polymerase-3 subunit epsilon